MSLLPYMMDNLLLNAPTPRYQHEFSVRPRDMMYAPFYRSLANLRPWASAGDTVKEQTHMDKDQFQVSLDVQHFAPNEINVKTVDNYIVVDAKHEERQDEHSYVTRQFQRRYRLPEGFNVKDVVSSMSSDGILTVKAPSTPSASEGNVRHVQIQQTGPARMNVTNQKEMAEHNAKAENGKK